MSTTAKYNLKTYSNTELEQTFFRDWVTEQAGDDSNSNMSKIDSAMGIMCDEITTVRTDLGAANDNITELTEKQQNQIKKVTIILPIVGWENIPLLGEKYLYSYTFSVNDISDGDFVCATPILNDLAEAGRCDFCPTVTVQDGSIVFYAAHKPNLPITIVCQILKPSEVN